MLSRPPTTSTDPSWKPPMQADPSGKINIPDTRKIDGVTGKPIVATKSMSAVADADLLARIVREAKKQQVDPYTALAIAHQETNFKDKLDPYHVDPNESDFRSNDDYIQMGIRRLKNGFQIAHNLGKTGEAAQIQAYNGYGKVGKNTEGHQRMMYGIDVSKTPIDMNKTPIYGKRIIDIRENILKKNPQIAKLVENTTP